MDEGTRVIADGKPGVVIDVSSRPLVHPDVRVGVQFDDGTSAIVLVADLVAEGS